MDKEEKVGINASGAKEERNEVTVALVILIADEAAVKLFLLYKLL